MSWSYFIKKYKTENSAVNRLRHFHENQAHFSQIKKVFGNTLF